VSNGTTAQQVRKISRAGLDARLDGWVISEEAGIRKPDPGIFEEAARRVGADLADAWMIGDSPTADIVGAHRCGLRSVWLSRGRTWPPSVQPASFDAGSLPEAVDRVLGARG
jgi:putative hydrolase of the HAD superfamily